MRTRCLALFLACLASVAGQAAEPPRLALVVGNGAYQTLPPLQSCIASARIVTATLQRAGFAVREQTNESNGRLGAAISDFGDALAAAPGATAVLYFCGYAVGFNGRVFLLPTPATLERPTDALTQGVVARLPGRAITGGAVRAGLILMDTVAPPGVASPTPFDTLLDGGGVEATGFVAVQSTGSAPQGPTTLAVAISAGFVQQPVELKALVQTLRNALAGPGTMVVVREPTAPRTLAGETAQPVVTQTPAPPAPAGGEPGTFWTPGPGELRRAQLALQRLGYFRGTIDGVAGPVMLAAVKQYQAENKLEATGRLTEDQLAQLLQAGR